MRSKLLRTILVAFLSLVIFACQPVGQRYLNSVADPALVSPLPNVGSISLDWQDMYLNIHHQIAMSPANMSIQGTIRFANHPQIMYGQARSLKVYLFLLDSENHVMSYQQILTSGRSSTQDSDSFKMNIQRPTGVDAYTFGYEVDFLESEPDSGMATVWNLPKKN